MLAASATVTLVRDWRLLRNLAAKSRTPIKRPRKIKGPISVAGGMVIGGGSRRRANSGSERIPQYGNYQSAPTSIHKAHKFMLKYEGAALADAVVTIAHNARGLPLVCTENSIRRRRRKQTR